MKSIKFAFFMIGVALTVGLNYANISLDEFALAFVDMGLFVKSLVGI
jgi:hypothetical protein